MESRGITIKTGIYLLIHIVFQVFQVPMVNHMIFCMFHE